MQKKSVFLVIICLFLGAASIQLSAQSENRTYQGWDEYSAITPIYCEGEEVDILSLDVKIHFVFHVKDGDVVWETDQIKGTATSASPGDETFKYREIDTYISENIIYFRYNAKGDMGTHYMGTMLVDISGSWGGEIFTPLRTVCK
jgi:hypothetical protein